ncbi:MAG TPA: TIGR03854 family LLM class F420-dependent oxidoreductase, partial [Pseudonocardiaceae bacterium]|nr:TIGR03854 family LLM class F420-dependent oxidoreductase [Pseudonocardiaceae bacterium]
MKVRIGVGLGAESAPATFGGIIDRLEAAGIDSAWFSEIVFSAQVEPFVAMANALGRTRKLKVGTGIAVLPGRHPVLLAKTLLSLAGLAPGRVLPAFGLRPARRDEWQVFPVPAGRRADVFDESMRLLRLLVTEDEVRFDGEFYQVDAVTVGPKPAKPLDIWLAGSAPAAFTRIGRYADGWLGSFLSPDEAARGRQAIIAAADEAGREIEDDHSGLSRAVATGGEVPAELLASARRRRPDADPSELIANGWG